MTKTTPTISCLVATLDRWELLQEAIDCFCRQTWPHKELVIATEGSETYQSRIAAHLDDLGRDDMRLIRLEGEYTLGKVRNTLLDEASGELVCQWDDDDLNHPERLRIQAEHLLTRDAKACFFTDQLQWFRSSGELFWTDWSRVGSGAGALIPGTLMMWRDLPVRYPEEGVYSRSGEDSALLESLISQVPVAGLRGRGFLSIYTYHGANTFDLQHHRQLALYRGADRTFIEDHRIALRRALAAYCLPRSPKITFKASGQEVFNLQTRQRRAILIYNRMFGEAPNLESVEGMERYEFTEDRSRYDEAVAVIFHIPDLPDTTHLRKRPGQIWVAWSMECEANYPQLVDAEFMAPFDLRMAYPLRSDINVNYVPTTLYEGEVGLDHPKSSTRLACSWISGLVDNSGREEYLRELARYMEIHFYGSQGDRVLENDQGRPTKLSVVGTYKFDLAFENTLAQDYVTEKFFDPLVAGTVPVYLGAPNVIDFAPTDHCFLDVRHYPRPADLAERLLELDRDDESYAQLVNWRSQPPRPGFREFYSVATSCPFRRLCDTLDEIWKQGEVEP